ncbi:hypothetical protein MANES_06G043300v8 [Manihot esculenta]|uniref:Uncharacterized protein n=1 Tax=Manihot esculenta TaxID=3983 RepID=A0ACB7HJM8_MANES|nr:hypothetical protein MANES_06G043300v8 [Manihot esculenta]
MENRVAIIGAGASGLVACKYTLNKGLTPIVFEAEETIGGVWARTIDSTRLQNTQQAYQFSDFPWPSSVQDLHPTHTQVMEYLESYAHHFKIFPCIKFNSRVISLNYVGESFEAMESWHLWSGTGKGFGSKGKWLVKVQHTRTCSIEEYHVEFVILCIGQFSGLPNIPEFPPDAGPQVFKGKVMHSNNFSAFHNLGVENFVKGKKVAVIGSFKSAVDIAAECANTNELLVHKPGETILFSFLVTLLSPLRWVISKFMESYVKWNLPLKKYGMLPKFRFDEDISSCQIALLPEKFFDKVEEGSIIIKNSQSFRFCREGLVIKGEAQPLETDIVIFATGFKGYEKLMNIFESSVFQDCIKATTPLLLYRQILHPRIPQLAIIGFNESFSTLGNSELKSLWIANFLDGKLELPCIKDMEKEAKMWGDHIKQSTGRYFKRGCIGNSNIWYNDQLCKDMGYNPRRKKGFLSDLFLPYAPADYGDLTIK